jgi:predicted O-methyltransferase YrrM
VGTKPDQPADRKPVFGGCRHPKAMGCGFGVCADRQSTGRTLISSASILKLGFRLRGGLESFRVRVVQSLAEELLMPAAAKAKPAGRGKRVATVREEQTPANTDARRRKYDFSIDLCAHNIPFYQKFLSHLKDKPCRLLEIGSFEGGSTTWLLDNIATHPDAFVDTIDVWEQPRLRSNLITGGHQNKVKFHQGRSADILRTLPLGSYDFAIIDGSHWTMNVLEDMVHSFRLLKIGGIMESDDYMWDDPEWNQEGRPKEAIDAFLSIYAAKIKILEKDALVWVQKIADPLWGL